MAPMWRRVLALSISAVVLFTAPGVLAGCGGSGETAEPPSGCVLDPDQLVVPRSALTGHPPADQWEVEIAVVKPDVDPAILLAERPREAGRNSRRSAGQSPATPGRTGTDSLTVADVATEPLDLAAEEAASAQVPLTPIPSPGLSWG